jgi:DNA repair exonuclease SbcCD ATPase subunit
MILLRRLRITAFKHLRNIDLWLPRRGSVLIEGHNESGKSTLFEAIYFALYGRALVGEDSGNPSLEALLPHGESRAQVHLAIQAGATSIEITRTLARGGKQVKHEAEARILRPGRPAEMIAAVGAVNDCILTEMNGLDSAVLRNSCLMEQQALDRIESLGRTDREVAIAKLLGIDAIQRIEKDIRVARKDEDQLRLAAIRLDVARQQRQVAQAEATAREAETALRVARAREAIAARDDLARQIDATQSALDELERDAATVRERGARAATLEALLAQSDAAGQHLRDAEQQTKALEMLRASQGQAAGAPDIASQLAQANSDITAAEAREQEQRSRIEAARQRARSSGLIAILAYIAMAAFAAGLLLPDSLWLFLPLFVSSGVGYAYTKGWQINNGVVKNGRAKLETLERDMIRLRARHETMQSIGNGGQESLETLAGQERKTSAARAASEQALRALASEMAAARLAAPADLRGLASPTGAAQAHVAMRRSVQNSLDGLDSQATQRQEGMLVAREQQLRAQRDELATRHESERHRLAALLSEQGMAAATGNEPMVSLLATWPALATAGDAETLAAALERASAVAQERRQEVAKLCRQHGLDAATLDADECQKAYDEVETSQRQRRLAAELADEVFRRIVQRVLPETETHMRALLPDLTDGRYRDVRLLSDEENSADLRIQLWDEQAGRFVGKNLFSGGTRDQSSLALRLAFALATLPKELGAMPGFIFLDEPLSSFDDRRSQALVDVLTRGAIARQFPQVFLISHSQSFDPAAFTCSLRMADGHIASSTLPGEQAASALWHED